MNHYLFQLLNSVAGKNPFLDHVIIFVAKPLTILVLIGALIFLFYHDPEIHRKMGYKSIHKMRIRIFGAVILSILFAIGIAEVMKVAFMIPRPVHLLEESYTLLVPRSFSFPSVYAALLAALSAGVYFFHHKAGKVIAFLAIIVGIARIMAGAHFPFDIFVGYFIGIISAIFIFGQLFPKERRMLKL